MLLYEKTFGDTMVGKDSDDKIQRITRLLEKGGTMLATHHECGAPMFRYQGKIICPVCDFQEEKAGKEQETGKVEELERRRIEEPGRAATLPADPYAVNNIITNKIRNIAISLENETDLGRVREKMECIEQGLKILKLMREKD
jgi:UPF0148 protein